MFIDTLKWQSMLRRAVLANRAWLALLAFTLIACTKAWYLSIENIDSEIVFCFSTSEFCSGDGVDLAMIDISEVDNQGKEVKPVWRISRREGEVVMKVVYGRPLAGWDQSIPPINLEQDKYYSVMDIYFFRINYKKEVEIISRENFFGRLTKLSSGGN